MNQEEGKISDLLTSLWERNLPLVRERLDVLDGAAAAAAAGNLDEALRAKACEIAHKLSGSLGMFGHHHGTEIARQMEQILDGSASIGSKKLTALTVELRRTLL